MFYNKIYNGFKSDIRKILYFCTKLKAKRDKLLFQNKNSLASLHVRLTLLLSLT